MFHLLILSKIVAKERFHELPPPLPSGSVKMAGAHLFTWLETFIICISKQYTKSCILC